MNINRVGPDRAANPGPNQLAIPTPLRELIPDPVRDWLDTARSPDRRRLFNAVDAAAGSAGFDAAVQAAETLIRRGDAPDAAGLGMLARRIANGTEPDVAGVDLGVYDNLVATAGEPAAALAGDRA